MMITLDRRVCRTDPMCRSVMGRATNAAAPKMNGKSVAVTLNAYARLPWIAWDSYWKHFGRGHLEDAARREARDMTAQGREMTVASCETLSLKIPVALSRDAAKLKNKNSNATIYKDDGDGEEEEEGYLYNYDDE